MQSSMRSPFSASATKTSAAVEPSPYVGMEAHEDMWSSVRTAEPNSGVEILQPFPPHVYTERLAAVHEAMEKERLDSLLLSTPESIHDRSTVSPVV